MRWLSPGRMYLGRELGRPAENRVEEAFEIILAAPIRRQSEPAANDGENPENHEGHEHYSRRFMHMDVMLVVTRLAVKREKNQTEHVTSGQQRSGDANEVKNEVRIRASVRVEENLVLAKKTGEKRRSGDGERGGEHRREGPGDFFAQAAHVLHVLLAAQGMNHAACREEKQTLEEGVGHQVENSGGVGADSAGQEHIAELRDGRVRENFFDVVLRQAYGGGIKRGDPANDGDGEHGGRRMAE